MICLLAVAGCGPMDDEPSAGGGGNNAITASAAHAAGVENVREKYTRAYAESRVGVVVETLRGEPFVAVGEVPSPGDFRESERVTFLDARERLLTTGTVVRVVGEHVHVRFDRAPRGGRAPRRGDIAVFRLPAGAPVL
jgi:hypothetical protein